MRKTRSNSANSLLLCAAVLLGTGLAGRDARANRLDDLISEYQEAKKASKLASTPGPKRRGAKRKEPPRLQPILMRIAGIGSQASLKFLLKEYGDPNPMVVGAAAEALLSTENEVAVRAVVKGYDRGRRWTLAPKVKVLDLLAQSSSETARTFVLRQAKSSNAEARLIALGSLAQGPKSAKVLEVLLENLEHRALEVRRASFRSIKKFRQKSMIPALIERIDKEKDSTLRNESLELLVRLTNLNMGLVHEDWDKWWKEEGDSFQLGKASSGKTRLVAPDLTYFGLEVTSSRIAFLVDASKSMQGPAGGGARRKKGQGGGGGAAGGGRQTKIQVLKKELTGILKKLPETTAVNIIYFHRGAFAWKDKLQSLRGNGRKEAIGFVQGLELELKTAIYDALEMALKDRRVDTIYLLSDGRPVGGKIADPDRILDEVRAINRLRGAKIHCISFGQETPFLKQLARQNDGVYRTTNPKAARKNGKGNGNRKGRRGQGGKNDPPAGDPGKN